MAKIFPPSNQSCRNSQLRQPEGLAEEAGAVPGDGQSPVSERLMPSAPEDEVNVLRLEGKFTVQLQQFQCLLLSLICRTKRNSRFWWATRESKIPF